MTVTTAPAERDATTRRADTPSRTRRVMFRVSALYGLSTGNVRMPLNETEFIDSGQVCVTTDPEADPASNVGIIDFDTRRLTVRYGIQAVFPGLYQLVTSGKHDPSLLHPVRAVATDECTLTPTYSGWHAIGCLEFLPGSLWAGAAGG